MNSSKRCRVTLSPAQCSAIDEEELYRREARNWRSVSHLRLHYYIHLPVRRCASVRELSLERIQLEISVSNSALPTARLHALGQSIWLDNITRTLLESGTLATYIANLSVTGLTSNPTIFEKAIGAGEAYDAQIRLLAPRGLSVEQVFFECAIQDLQRAADHFGPIHAATNRIDGFVSLEVSPLLANDTAGTVAQAIDLHARANRPNLFIKVPGTPEGCPAIEELIFRGIPINVTLLFSREHYLAAVEAYTRGIERRVAAGLSPFVGSVASVFVSRWDRACAKNLPANLQNTVGIAMAGRIIKAATDFHATPRWKALAAKGATEQRVLWASTGTKDPALAKTLYVDVLGGPNTVDTMPEETLLDLSKTGNPQRAMPTDGVAAEATLSAITAAGIDLNKVAAQLQIEGRDSFDKSWHELIAKIGEKVASIA